ncbi:MAG: DUF2344 domain-containing protein, partial [Candidatus Omnitrophica bacterium]|nr:DUF2344 domain-containing protein [Candidatus Omnitrophota bacterium]
ALRRSGLPVYFTQGFNPRVKISFNNGLKLGISGNINCILYFIEDISFDRLYNQLNPQLPEGLQIQSPDTP